MIKLVLTDLDDTLIPHGSESASARSREAIHVALEAGLHFGPLTGRPPADMAWMFAGDAACYASGGFANGQIMYLDGQVVREVPISRALLERVQLVLDEFGEAFLTLYDPYKADSAFFVTKNTEITEALEVFPYGISASVLEKVADFPAPVEDPEPGYLKANIHCSCSQERMVDLRNLLAKEIPELGFVFPSLHAPLIDVTPGGWNKGSAVLALAEALGVTPDEVAVFGDSDNDLAMIRAVPNSVAVANASEEIAGAARWHIGASADDAVADALLDMAEALQRQTMPSFMTGA